MTKSTDLEFVLLKLPRKLSWKTSNRLKLKRCRFCSKELGGDVYHMKDGKDGRCYFNHRLIVNEGHKRSQKSGITK